MPRMYALYKRERGTTGTWCRIMWATENKPMPSFAKARAVSIYQDVMLSASIGTQTRLDLVGQEVELRPVPYGVV